jgi:hypothetical protein
MTCTVTIFPWYASILLDSRVPLKILLTDDNLLEYFQIQKIMLFGSSIEDKSRSSLEKCRVDRGTTDGTEGHKFKQIKCCWNLENKRNHHNIYLCELQMIDVNDCTRVNTKISTTLSFSEKSILRNTIYFSLH